MKNLISITLLVFLSVNAFSQDNKEEPENTYTAMFLEANTALESRLKIRCAENRLAFTQQKQWKKFRKKLVLDSIKIADQIIKPLQKTSAFKQ